VCPTVHYNMGGIPTLYTGEVVSPTASDPDRVVKGLYACGEAACASAHGANRLGANSLLDLVVFGRAVANHIGEKYKPGGVVPSLPSDAGSKTIDNLDHLRNSKGAHSTASIRLDMQKTMQAHAAVYRADETLKKGVKEMDRVVQSFKDVGIKDRR
jgi:succinate dehydrogenase/fumarate reductase flavoprotein subunit